MTITTPPEMKKDIVRVAFPPKLYQKAKKHAKESAGGISAAAYMREAVARRIEAEEKRRQRERRRHRENGQ
jgi:hypothetical protein